MPKHEFLSALKKKLDRIIANDLTAIDELKVAFDSSKETLRDDMQSACAAAALLCETLDPTRDVRYESKLIGMLMRTQLWGEFAVSSDAVAKKLVGRNVLLYGNFGSPKYSNAAYALPTPPPPRLARDQCRITSVVLAAHNSVHDRDAAVIFGSGIVRGKPSPDYIGNPLIAFSVDTVGFRSRHSRNGCVGYRIDFDLALDLYAESQSVTVDKLKFYLLGSIETVAESTHTVAVSARPLIAGPEINFNNEEDDDLNVMWREMDEARGRFTYYFNIREPKEFPDYKLDGKPHKSKQYPQIMFVSTYERNTLFNEFSVATLPLRPFEHHICLANIARDGNKAYRCVEFAQTYQMATQSVLQTVDIVEGIKKCAKKLTWNCAALRLKELWQIEYLTLDDFPIDTKAFSSSTTQISTIDLDNYVEKFGIVVASKALAAVRHTYLEPTALVQTASSATNSEITSHSHSEDSSLPPPNMRSKSTTADKLRDNKTGSSGKTGTTDHSESDSVHDGTASTENSTKSSSGRHRKSSSSLREKVKSSLKNSSASGSGISKR